jgi:hypothetical protein
LVGLDGELCGRGQRSVGPDRVDGVGFDWDQRGTALGERGRGVGDPGSGVQPCVVADPAALGGVLGEPCGRAGLRHRFVSPVRAVDLFADLDRVATVGEDRGAIGEDDGGAGRAAEAGKPAEALGVAADIFAHVLIGEGDDETVEIIGG